MGLDLIVATDSRSGGPDPNIMVRPVTFAKEPLIFSRFNPQSNTSQKKLQLGPGFYQNPPDLPGFSARRPETLVLLVSP